MKNSSIPALCLATAAALVLPRTASAETVTAVPDAFLEYIESTGAQYIDTGVKAETGLKARMDGIVSSSTANDSAILCARHNSNLRFFMFHCNATRTLVAHANGSDPRFFNNGHPLDRRFEELADFSDGTAIQAYINGLSLIPPAKQSAMQLSAPDPATGTITANDMGDITLYLFAANDDGTAKWHSSVKLYELKILKKNGSGGFDLLRHYLPCIKNGRAGLYDKVHGTISYSFSSAEFVDGPVLDKPLDFVKWIWSNGKQYFNTWVWGKGGLRSEVDVGVSQYEGDRCILGCRGSSGDTRLYMAYHYESAFRYAYGKLPSKANINVVAPTNDVSNVLATRYLIATCMSNNYQSVTVSKNGDVPIELHKDGQSYLAVTNNLATTNTLYLMANNRYGTATCPSQCILYRTKIWDGDELLRDFVPVVATNSSGEAYAGLYDRVSERIYQRLDEPANGGSTIPEDFNLATQVGCVTNSLRIAARPVTRIEYVESDGKYDYVDLGVMANAGLETEVTAEWLTIPNESAFLGARSKLAGNTDWSRIFPYSTYSGSQHAYHYNSNRYTARDSGNVAVQIKTNVLYKIVSRIEQGAQNFAVWSRGAGGRWEKLGERTTTTATSSGLGENIILNLPLYLFAVNEDDLARFFVKARCYGLKISVKQQDGSYALMRDFVPVRDPATGGAALWDKISETIFRNDGKYLLAGGGEERAFEEAFVLSVR